MRGPSAHCCAQVDEFPDSEGPLLVRPYVVAHEHRMGQAATTPHIGTLCTRGQW